MSSPQEVAPGVWLIPDTCNVYLIKADGADTAVTIDFGSGEVLGHLAALGIDRITDVLMTHHHRDQGQGLPAASAHGARIHVPPVELELFDRVDEMWASRQLDNDYNVRQDRFSLLEPVDVHATVPEYREFDAGGVTLRPIPTPGHTIGSVTYLLERGGGGWPSPRPDLRAGQGVVARRDAVELHRDRGSRHGGAQLLPAGGRGAGHAPPVARPPARRTGAGARAARIAHAVLRRLPPVASVGSRRPAAQPVRARHRPPAAEPLEPLLQLRPAVRDRRGALHRLRLRHDHGAAHRTGPRVAPAVARVPAGAEAAVRRDPGERHARHPLSRRPRGGHAAAARCRGHRALGVGHRRTGARRPWKHDLPCQWYEPIVVDRTIPTGSTVRWNEYEITVHDQPGHTIFASAFEVEVDGVRVVFTGDQQEGLGIPGERHEILNYQYRNRFRLGDYVQSAELYRRIAPGLLLSGHWEPRWVDDGYLDYLRFAADDLDEMHDALLPLDELDLGSDGILCRIFPYRARVAPGEQIAYVATVRNPHPTAVDATVAAVLPAGWTAAGLRPLRLEPREERELSFTVTAGAAPVRRARLALDVTLGELRLGQHAEALIDVV